MENSFSQIKETNLLQIEKTLGNDENELDYEEDSNQELAFNSKINIVGIFFNFKLLHVILVKSHYGHIFR